MQPEQPTSNQPTHSPVSPLPTPTPVGPPPQKNRTGLIVGLVIGGMVVIGIVITIIVLLTRPSTTQNNTNSQPGTSSQSKTQAPENFANAKAVAEAYVRAYEMKDFSAVVNEANTCQEYIDTYGLDVSELEASLQPYKITGEVNDERVLAETVSEVDITITLQTASGTPTPKSAFIKAVKEDGAWKFCGEGGGE